MTWKYWTQEMDLPTVWPFWAVAIAITPPFFLGSSCLLWPRMKPWLTRCHPWACRWWRVRWKMDVLQTWKIIGAKAPKVVCFLPKSPKVSWEVKIYLSLQIRWCFGSWRTPDFFLKNIWCSIRECLGHDLGHHGCLKVSTIWNGAEMTYSWFYSCSHLYVF